MTETTKTEATNGANAEKVELSELDKSIIKQVRFPGKEVFFSFFFSNSFNVLDVILLRRFQLVS